MSTQTNIFMKPWFIASIVFGCFAVLMPKIIIPLYKQLFSINKPSTDTYDRRINPVQPQVQPQSSSAERHGPSPFGAGAAYQRQQQETQSSFSSKSILTFILPVYAVGIAVYMFYTLFKVYNKKSNENGSSSLHMDENYSNYNIKWNSNKKRFINNAYENEDSDDVDFNDYTNLDPDYVDYLRKKRRKERQLKQQQQQQQQVRSNNAHVEEIIENCTNERDDLNDVLNVMKNSLNNINKKLMEAERKGGPMEDNDLQTLRLQLANTELQMIKILHAMDNTTPLNENIEPQNDENFSDECNEKPQTDNDEINEKMNGSSNEDENENECDNSTLKMANKSNNFKKKKAVKYRNRKNYKKMTNDSSSSEDALSSSSLSDYETNVNNNSKIKTKNRNYVNKKIKIENQLTKNVSPSLSRSVSSSSCDEDDANQI